MLFVKLVQCTYRTLNCTQWKPELPFEMEFYHDFYLVPWQWRRTLTNGSDVKYSRGFVKASLTSCFARAACVAGYGPSLPGDARQHGEVPGGPDVTIIRPGRQGGQVQVSWVANHVSGHVNIQLDEGDCSWASKWNDRWPSARVWTSI